MKLKLKRALRYLSSHSKNNEWDRAVQWYDMKKNEIKNKFSKSGQRLVNEEFIEDHISGKTDDLSNRLFMGGN
jgi:hypothetical protein